MLFTPSVSWYGFPELYEGKGEAGFVNFWLEDLVGEAVEDDGVVAVGMAEGGHGSYAFLKVLLTVGEAAASERERPVVERPKVLGSEVV